MPKNSQKTGEADFKVGIFQEYFGTKKFTYRQEIDRIDFIITDNADRHLIWAETKKNAADIVEMFVQLILTIGKARTFDRINPPPFLCAFDYEKIAFLQYNAVHDIFYQNDFNWNITPSDKKTKEFAQIKEIVEKTVNEKNLIFFFDNDKTIIKKFIKDNFSSSADLFPELFTRLQIDKNNFVPTYNRWVEMVKPSINIDWDKAKARGIIDGDFYLADLLSENNITIKDKLFVLLKKTNYELDRQLDDMGLFTSKTVFFKDEGKSHWHFWELYIRPPKQEYWDYIVDRRDLLVPQDIRERKGSFFTPQIWVQKSQDYLTMVFGENWQDEYYVWDCAAGTGNLLVGLTNKYKIWASTLDRQDVDVMQDRINNGANLLPDHVFQFDFLNDSFDKLPQGLQEIIHNSEKRKKLIIYINPPYAEAGNRETIVGKGSNKSKVSASRIYDEFKGKIGNAILELSAQFILRVYRDIPDSKLATFSTIKYINSPNFISFREYFRAEYKRGFVCKANSFDNVSGEFPIGFFIWDLENKQKINSVLTDVYITDSDKINCTQNGIKNFNSVNKGQLSVDWLRKYFDKEGKRIAYLRLQVNDIQHKNGVFITSKPSERDFIKHEAVNVTEKNLIQMIIYCAIRQVIEATWLNNKSNFQFPNNKWETDIEFQNNCLVNVLFDNNIQSAHGINHWIPFTEQEVNAKNNFQSNFMSNYLKSKTFSAEAQNVLNSGRELWKYYHAKIANIPNASVDASFYDIREFFQGRSEKGTMNQKSTDEKYNALIKDLRQNLSLLAEKIKPKVYEYGFLIE